MEDGLGSFYLQTACKYDGRRADGDEQELGVGSTFTALLPTDSRGIEDEEPSEAPVRTKEVQQELALQSAEKKVLVIDDDPIVRDLMKNHLENDGFEVLLAEGGKEGIHLARTEKPSVITLDILMPGDGWMVGS